MNFDTTTKRILLFLAITFGITYISEIILLPKLMNNTTLAMYTATAISLVMYVPAISALLTRLFTKEGFTNLYLRIDIKKSIKYLAIAWFLPALLVIIGGALFYLFIPESFDSSMSYIKEMYATLGSDFTTEELRMIMISQLGVALALGPALNILTCLGEELGWRGYLLPNLLKKFSILPTLLISGVIWGLWHAPLTVIIGHNYGFDYVGYPYLGILAMCIFCIVLGVFLTWLTMHTGSCVPAAIAHAGMNSIAAISLFYLSSEYTINSFLGPIPTGLIGGCGFIVLAIFLTITLIHQEKKEKLLS